MTIQIMVFTLPFYKIQGRFIGSRCCFRLCTHRM